MQNITRGLRPRSRLDRVCGVVNRRRARLTGCGGCALYRYLRVPVRVERPLMFSVRLVAALLAFLTGGLATPVCAVTFVVNSIFDVAAAPPLDDGVCETAPGN